MSHIKLNTQIIGNIGVTVIVPIILLMVIFFRYRIFSYPKGKEFMTRSYMSID